MQLRLSFGFVFFIVVCGTGIFLGIEYKKRNPHVSEGLKILTPSTYNRKAFLSSAGRLVSTLNSI